MKKKTLSTTEQTRRLTPGMISLIVIILLVAVTTTAIVITENNNSSTGQTTNSTVNETNLASYEDGTYRAIGSYFSPGGQATVELTVTLENGVITSTELATGSAPGESQVYIDQFIDGYEVEVIGKEIETVQLSRVAGASLTSIGFNDALDQIKDDARV